MDTLVSYLIKSFLISGLLLGYYASVLRNRRFHSFNRGYLLSALLASLVLPLIRLSWLSLPAAGGQSLGGLFTGIDSHSAAPAVFSLPTIALAVSVMVSGLFLLVLAGRILRVYGLKRRYPSLRIEGCRFIEIKDPRAPFSFLDLLFWQEGVDIDDPINRKIFNHELAHIRGRHTYDNLFALLLASLFWMNPFYWLIRRELMMIHEFMADDASIAEGDTATFARMLLQAYNGGQYLDPSHRFFHSPIKRRLLMITSSKHSSRNTIRKTLAVPVLLAVMALACSKEQSAPAEQIKSLPKAVSLTLKKITVKGQNLVFIKAPDHQVEVTFVPPTQPGFQSKLRLKEVFNLRYDSSETIQTSTEKVQEMSIVGRP